MYGSSINDVRIEGGRGFDVIRYRKSADREGGGLKIKKKKQTSFMDAPICDPDTLK